jgi:hypothetical protein
MAEEKSLMDAIRNRRRRELFFQLLDALKGNSALEVGFKWG